MSILEMTNINKSFPGVHALIDASLTVRAGEVHILLGENGAGKSTLVKILSGAYSLDSGSITLHGEALSHITPKSAQDHGISIIYQELNLVPTLSVAENIFLGREPINPKVPGKIWWRRLWGDAKNILQELQLDINPKAVVRDLGIAQQQMVEVAKALSNNARIIVMDEPTAVLTENEIDNFFQIIHKIKSDGISIIYISHRLEELKRIGDRITVMRDGRTISTLNAEDSTIPELIRLMVGRELSEKFPREEKEIGEEQFRVKHLTRGQVIKDINFHIRKGEILGIAGLVGSGRTELARAIFGVDKITGGEIYINNKPVHISSPHKAIDYGLGFVTEDRKQFGLVLPMSVGHNISLAKLDAYTKRGRIRLKAENKDAQRYIQRLNIKTTGHDQKVNNLSGGNQQKVVLAKWMLSQADIFIFDEPTRGIDVGAKIEVYALMNELVKSGASIMMISSELPEIIGMSDRIMVMCRGEMLAELERGDATQERILYYAAGGGKYIG